jgi:Kef-type K+ transport system membrane component KefB
MRLAIGRFMTIAVLIGFYWLIRSLDPLGGAGTGSTTAMALGFLLLASFLAGQLAKLLELPRITGYLACGLVIGPEVLGLLTSEEVAGLDVITALAVGVIAFIAGGELRPAMIRERGRTILVMLFLEVGAVFLAVSATLLALRPWVPFLAETEVATSAVLIALFASIATIHSPAVTIALLNEQQPKGPLTSTTLGIVVAADVVVVLLATAALGLARTVVVEDQGGGGAFLGTLAWELIGALVAGAVLGTLVDFYLRTIGARYEIFALALAFFGGMIADAIHVEYMLFMLSAGFFVENVSPADGEPLLTAFERVSVPAYALFFSLAGASIHIAEIRALWPIALAVVAVRAAGLWAGCRLGARVVDAEPAVARYTWLGLISQAGVALGLVTVVAEALPEVGGGMLTLFLAMIAIHEIAGPIAFRHALVRSGEAGGARAAPARPHRASVATH